MVVVVSKVNYLYHPDPKTRRDPFYILKLYLQYAAERRSPTSKICTLAHRAQSERINSGQTEPALSISSFDNGKTTPSLETHLPYLPPPPPSISKKHNPSSKQPEQNCKWWTYRSASPRSDPWQLVVCIGKLPTYITKWCNILNGYRIYRQLLPNKAGMQFVIDGQFNKWMLTELPELVSR